VALAAGLSWRAFRVNARPPVTGEALSVRDVLAGGGEGFALALRPRPLVFPADHGPHPRYRSEWWYFTGHLRDSTGRRFGFQLTFFRFALTPHRRKRASRWATNQVYLAHYALTDIEGGRFHAAERRGRGALQLAGARSGPFKVWIGDWVAAGGADRDLWPLRLRAGDADSRIDLVAERGKPRVLQGDRGLSRKSAKPGNASYYYSYPRLPVHGVVRVGARKFSVSGTAWFDREWGSSALGRELRGWDWFGVQLDDGRELMYYRLRRADGGIGAMSAGVLVAADGSVRRLAADAVRIETLKHWRSPRTGISYPAGWRLRVPEAGLDLKLLPRLADQELKLSLRYWEGAVAVHGSADGVAVGGDAYVELVGYGSDSWPRGGAAAAE